MTYLLSSFSLPILLLLQFWWQVHRHSCGRLGQLVAAKPASTCNVLVFHSPVAVTSAMCGDYYLFGKEGADSGGATDAEIKWFI